MVMISPPFESDILAALNRKLKTHTAWIYAESAAEITRLRTRVAELEAKLAERKRRK
jgi:hypothetical protein